VGAAGAPPHLLFLDHPFADHLVDGGLLLITWLTADSAIELEMTSPAR